MSGIDFDENGFPVTLNIPCIYQIVNLVTGDKYIGSSWTGSSRIRRHYQHLKQGKHCSPYLQRAYNKYGIGCFQVDYLRTFRASDMTRDALYRLEQDYIDHFKPAYNGLKKVFHHLLSSDEQRVASTRRTQTYIVTAPDGASQQVTNLTAFCRQHGLNPTNMGAVARGSVSNHQGWKCVYADGSSPPYVCRRERQWIVTNPSGQESTVTNLAAFCRQHGLINSAMQVVARGVASQHKGWMCRYATDTSQRYVKRPYGPKPKDKKS